jgi:hypothetical protein
MAFNSLFRCKWLADGSHTLSEMANKLEAAAQRLREMEMAGVRLDGVVEEDYAEFVTDDPAVAQKYNLKDEDEEEEEEEDEVSEKDYDHYDD